MRGGPDPCRGPQVLSPSLLEIFSARLEKQGLGNGQNLPLCSEAPKESSPLLSLWKVAWSQAWLWRAGGQGGLCVISAQENGRD